MAIANIVEGSMAIENYVSTIKNLVDHIMDADDNISNREQVLYFLVV